MKKISIFWKAGIYVTAIAVTLICCLFFSDAKTNPEAGVIAWLPSEMMGHIVEDGEMGKEEKEWLPSDTTFLKKTYLKSWLPPAEAREQAISASLVVAGSDSRSLHRPQVCLTSQGWTIEKRERVLLETEGGMIEVMDFHLSRVLRHRTEEALPSDKNKTSVLKAHYVYWWIGPGASTASDEKKVLLEVFNSILKGRRERWAYPSVLVIVDEERESSQEVAYQFIREYAPLFQKSLGAVDREDAVELKLIGN